MKQIGIIGSGDVGKALSLGFVKSGYSVMLGSRTPEKLKEWHKQTGKDVQLGTFEQAGEFGEIVVLAVGWQHLGSAVGLTGQALFSGKIVIDVTNPLDFSGGFPPRLAVSGDDSGGETIQRLLPDSRVVKAFNIVGNASMYQPDFVDGDPTMWICGNGDSAKTEVTEILGKFGWRDVIDIGGIEGSRLLESLCILWTISGKKLGSWHIAFKLLHK